MKPLKNVRPHSIDVGGQMLPSGQSADLDETSPAVAESIELGHLVPVQSGDPVPAPAAPRSKPKENS